MFIDEARIFVQGGDGGNGAVSFHREKFVAQGGPDGGDGGRGGDIVFVVDSGLSTLMDFRHQRHFRAPSGSSGMSKNRHGADGDDITVPVPPGTMVFNEEPGALLADLTQPGQSAVVARGGRGGKGNSRFASSVHRIPRVAEKGAPGQAFWIRLELNLLADVGLVGFPNAGKSTLISTISRSKPRIADYPFTTLVPNLGVVTDWGDPFVVADVPGLIEGAHEGAGLGMTFLRHLARTRLLLHLVDVSDLNERDSVNDFRIIRHELKAFSPELAARPTLVVATKMDQPGSRERLLQLTEALAGETVWPLSSVTREGLDALMWEVRSRLDALPPPAPRPVEQTVAPPVTGFQVVSDDEGVRLVGDVEERAEMTFWGNPYAETYFCEYLRRRGVPQALRRARVADETVVRVGEGQVLWSEGQVVPVPQ